MDVSKKISISYRAKAITQSIKQKKDELKELEKRLLLLQNECKCPESHVTQIDNTVHECDICKKMIIKKKKWL